MTVSIGGTAIRIATSDAVFDEALRAQYAGFIGPDRRDSIRMTVRSILATGADPDADIEVKHENGCWVMVRGDFHASYTPAERTATVHQTAGRYGIDSAIRIIHSLELAERRGFLLHAASVIRDGRAFLFAGPSGAGKTTISRLAGEDTHLLTDEISCVRKCGNTWTAFGTPFAGELAQPGENLRARAEALYLLQHGPENQLEPLSATAATRSILRNVLFFAQDSRLSRLLFDTVCEFVESLRVFRLAFVPDARVWSLIR